jgi:hypothetical protein
MQPSPAKLSLIEPFQDLRDPRVVRTKAHELIDILVIAICTKRCGGERFNYLADFGKAMPSGSKPFSGGGIAFPATTPLTAASPR